MRAIWGHLGAVITTGLIASAVMPACATNDQSIYIRNVLAPPQNRQGGSCIYTDDPQQPGLFEGTFDLGVTDTYFAKMIVGNQLIARSDPTTGPRSESNRVHLNGAVVRVTDPAGNLIREFTSTGTGFADSQQNNAPDFGLIGARLIDAATSAILKPTLRTRDASRIVVANVKVFGQTLGGTEVETGEFQFPIEVCNGCLVSFNDANDPLIQPNPNCLKPLASGGGGGGVTLPCSIGTDEVTPCQLCAGRPVCDPLWPGEQ